MRSAMKKSTWTFQMYCGILLGVKLDIQSVLCNLYGSEWNAGCLQNLTILVLIADTQYMDKSKEKDRANEDPASSK